ncbi:hypothetical protein FQA39_LY19289 [Lamprigera yunnana]|nr:hypothetical protein FQA39_LY19289 [Lamprigera yunnana]
MDKRPPRVGESTRAPVLLACVLWQDVKAGWDLRLGRGEHPFPALQDAIDEVFNLRIGDVSGRGNWPHDMREIWVMQPRFEKRTGSTPFGMIAQPRFRAGFDFLRLRADVGEVDEALATGWPEVPAKWDDTAARPDRPVREEQRAKPPEAAQAPSAAAKNLLANQASRASLLTAKQAAGTPWCTMRCKLLAHAGIALEPKMTINPQTLPLSTQAQRLPGGDAAPPPGQAVRAWIGLGANLGDRGQAMQQALQQLHITPGVVVEQVSPLYASKPVDSDGPDYLNAWPSSSPSYTGPRPCCACAAHVEQAAGRERTYRKRPPHARPGCVVRQRLVRKSTPTCIVPHPAMWQRAFVLAPLQALPSRLGSDAQLPALLDAGCRALRGAADGRGRQVDDGPSALSDALSACGCGGANQVLDVAVQKMHLTVDNATLARALQDIPQIAALKKPDGSLDVEAYRALVGAQGMTPEGFEANMRRDLALRQVLGGVSNTAFVTDAQTQAAIDALYQQREIQVARFDAKSFASQVKASDADLDAFYKGNQNWFRQQEQSTIDMWC